MRFATLLTLSGCWILTKRDVCEHELKVEGEAGLSKDCRDFLDLEYTYTRGDSLPTETDTDTDSDTDADSDADTDSDSDADTDTPPTGETGTTLTETADTGLYLGQLCLTVMAPVVGQVQMYVFEANLDDGTYWVDPTQEPVVGTMFASGDASGPICNDMSLVPYVAGHTLLVLGTWQSAGEQSLVTGDAGAGYVSLVQEIALSGTPLVCISTSNAAAAPYPYSSCTL